MDAPSAVYGPVILGPGLFVVQWGHLQGGWWALVRILWGAEGRLGIVRRICRGLWPVGPSARGPY